MNVQTIHSAVNCAYDIFAVTAKEFSLIFVPGSDIAFIDEVCGRHEAAEFDAVFNRIWQRRVRKCEAVVMHGILFYELAVKKQFYPMRRAEEAVNPNGTRLR